MNTCTNGEPFCNHLHLDLENLLCEVVEVVSILLYGKIEVQSN